MYLFMIHVCQYANFEQVAGERRLVPDVASLPFGIIHVVMVTLSQVLFRPSLTYPN